MYTPFKVGSSSLSRTIEKTFRIKQLWLNQSQLAKKKVATARPLIFRGHTLGLKEILSLPDVRFSAWITIIRRPLDMLPSCYFQDITNPDYPYYFGSKKQVNKATPRELRDRFSAFEWETWPASSYDYNFAQIKAYTGLDLWKLPFDKDSGFMVHQPGFGRFDRVGVIRLDRLDHQQTLFDFFSQLNLLDKTKVDVSDIHLEKENQGRKKWYGRQYHRFVSGLGPDYYTRFSKLNSRIEQLFFETSKNETMDGQ